MRENIRLFRLFCILTLFFFAGALALKLDIFSIKEASTQETETPVSMLAAGDVESVSWSGGEDGGFTLIRDTAGNWSSAENENASLDQDKINSAVTALCQVISTREIESADDAAAYGLTPCERQVVIALADGTTVTYQLGKRNTYTNRYYLRLDDGTTIHMVGYSVGEAMLHSLSDFEK